MVRSVVGLSLVASTLLTGCAEDELVSGAPCDEPAALGDPFGVRCGQLVDPQGRVRFIRGVNARVEGIFDVTFDDGRIALEEVPPFDESDGEAIRDWGFDSLRLPINWSAVEPTEDGGFDEAYLDLVEQTVDDAASAGLTVLIDFHQDAYSKEIGEDGAPLWAIEPPPTVLLEGPLTDLEDRRLSEQVLAAFTTFFGPSADGARLRDRFAAMAAHVAARFAHHPAVYGFEIFNEPQADDDGVDRLNEVAHEAMRAAASDKLYLFEPGVMRNFLDQARIVDSPLGEMTGYSPHVYTYAFTSNDEQKAGITKELLRRSNENARVEADGWQAPLIITEWGFDPGGVNGENYLVWQTEFQEEFFASSYFWLWKEQSQGQWGCYDHDEVSGTFSERTDLKQWMARIRPLAVAGWPQSSSYDRVTGTYTLTFHRDPTISGLHLISIAPVLGVPNRVSCDGTEMGFSQDDYGVMSVECSGEELSHRLTVEL